MDEREVGGIMRILASRALGGRRILMVVAAAIALAGSGGQPEALAGHSDGTITTGVRSGPIHLGETTIAGVKEFFGEPDWDAEGGADCGGSRFAEWTDEGFRIIYDTDSKKVWMVNTLGTSSSSTQGELQWRTVKGLRVGDGQRKMRRLYPKAEKEGTFDGTTLWKLHRPSQYRLLTAATTDGRVIQIQNYGRC